MQTAECYWFICPVCRVVEKVSGFVLSMKHKHDGESFQLLRCTSKERAKYLSLDWHGRAKFKEKEKGR